jgi:hypothetical protein
VRLEGERRKERGGMRVTGSWKGRGNGDEKAWDERGRGLDVWSELG